MDNAKGTTNFGFTDEDGEGKFEVRSRRMTSVAIQAEEDDDSIPEEEASPIKWIYIIFLPFLGWWQLLIVFVVILKCTLGPLSSIYPFLYCYPELEKYSTFQVVKYFYIYVSDILYGIDTCLYVAHRQVTDEAMKREHLPKSAALIFLDLLSMLPLFDFMGGVICTSLPHIWPNILKFNEMLCIYRVAQFFSLNVTHSYWNLLTGYIIMLLLVTNALTCFFLLLTYTGLCEKCASKNAIYDWRMFSYIKLKGEQRKEFYSYFYAATYLSSLLTHFVLDETEPTTYIEFVLAIILIETGFLFLIFAIMPKLFAENLQRFNIIYLFQGRVNRVLENTVRRNESATEAHKAIEKFYTYMWMKQNGITSMPTVINDLPICFQLEIKLDLTWPFFFHSPILRHTSMSYKRWLAQRIQVLHKLPGERFFLGSHCFSNMYYIRSGIVQFISSDDSSIPIVSVSGGTIFGDMSFLIPPLKRQVIVRCLTYCEIFSISRTDLLHSLTKFPEDSRNIRSLQAEKMQHAKELFNNKQKIRGLDRCQDEGIKWFKHRWQNLTEMLSSWKITDNNNQICVPRDNEDYHCSKYIGQLVLCKKIQLLTRTMFNKVTFPWILDSDSTFIHVWKKIVKVTVYLTLVLFPPTIVRLQATEPMWFLYVNFFVNLVYSGDVFISIITDEQGTEHTDYSLMTRIVNRCKNKEFVLDLMSTPFFTFILRLLVGRKLVYLGQFNRLIKIHVLFSDKIKQPWDANHLHKVYHRIGLTHFCSNYIPAYFFFLVIQVEPKLTSKFFYGDLCLPLANYNASDCDSSKSGNYGILTVALTWLTTFHIPEYLPNTLEDLELARVLALFYIFMWIYLKIYLISTLYLSCRYSSSYQYFVTNIKNHYGKLRVHPDLLKRLDRFTNLHWKFYKGMDIILPNVITSEPYDIYYKLHGETAESIIRETNAFKGANPLLIRDLARHTRFLIIPKGAIVNAYGVQSETVNWLVRGSIRCEYQDDDGENVDMFLPTGCILAMINVFFGLTALRTYSAASDCELLYMLNKDLVAIIKHYPEEWSYFQNAISEMGEAFIEMHEEYVKKFQTYEKTLRERIFHQKHSIISMKSTKSIGNVMSSKWRNLDTYKWGIWDFLKEYRTHPESRFIRTWLIMRAITVPVGLLAFAFQGGIGAVAFGPLIKLANFCNIFVILDIIFKLWLPYYDDRGIVISSFRKCLARYLTRGFICDILGFFGAMPGIILVFIGAESRKSERIVMAMCQILHLYLVFGCFNYYTNRPSMNTVFLEILKWQVISFTLFLVASYFYIWDCIWLDWDTNYNLKETRRYNDTCWLPVHFDLDAAPTIHQLHVTFVQSLSLIQNSFMGVFMGGVYFNKNRVVECLLYFLLNGMAWYQTCFILSKLMLYHRGDDLINSDIKQLKMFLVEERVDKKLIERSLDHFSYFLKRSPPVDIKLLMNDSFSIVFRQDLFHYFYKKTLKNLDGLINGGKPFCRQLAAACRLMFFLPGAEILRENQLALEVFIVHRGKVEVYQNDSKIATLTEGAIFGQLRGKLPRPSRILVRTIEHADILIITRKEFREIMNEQVFEMIPKHPTSKNDYIAIKSPEQESPYDTIQYLLRAKKTIKLPKMRDPVSSESNWWYARWLLLSWVIGPIITAALVLILINMPPYAQTQVMIAVFVLDFLYILYLVSEAFTMKLQVEEKNCVYRYIGWMKVTEWWLITDVVSVIVPLITFFTEPYKYQLFRLLRLYNVYMYQRHFRGFRVSKERLFIKILLVLLLIHGLTCAWLSIACKSNTTRDYFPITLHPPPSSRLRFMDRKEWAFPGERRRGCPRTTGSFFVNGSRNDRKQKTFIVPRNWRADYLIALTFICILQTNTNLDSVLPITIGETYFKIFARYILYLVEIWLCSIVISSIYTSFRAMYHYDFRVAGLVLYLKQNGVCDFLLNAVQVYTRLLWQKYKGSQLPAITHQAPLCLQEDIFSSLYMHHLQAPTIFRSLPMYFLRQVAVKLQRTVIFPGKTIVKEGDIHPTMYFIHEGEVEKMYTDSYGEQRVATVLSTCGYFGLLPGLFPEVPYMYSYSSRTVVDLIYLRYDLWQDLLNGYPALKEELYKAANEIRTPKKADKVIQHDII